MWEADTCDFVLVTLALLRIQQVMYDLSPDFVMNGSEPSSRRALIVPAPGSHHTIGAAMVADFFRREGWDVMSSHELTRADVLRTLRQEWFDVVAVLSQREFSLLAFLMRSPGHIYSRQQILKHVWEINFDPETNVVDVCVRRIKRKLERGNMAHPSPIEAVRGVGYRLRLEA